MPIEYVPFAPEPIDGQALLNNFTRTQRLLRYRGSNGVFRTIDRGMPLYETDLVETVGEADSGNMVLRGDCLSACAFLKTRIDAGNMPPIDLVYIDPPFASGADYAKQVYLRRNPKLADKAREAEQQLDDEELRAFEEVMYGDIWDKERYLNWMYENLRAIKTVMSESGSIYVHLDGHIGFYVKILLDEIFGEENCVNTIVWKRNFAHGDTGQGAQHFGRVSDFIFLYRMGDSFTFKGGFTDYTQEYIDKVFRYADPDGRRWQSLPVTAPGGAAKGNPYFEFMGVNRYWRFTEENLNKMLEEGRIVQSRPGAVPRQKGYLDESKGVPLQDIWTDIPAVQGQATEYVNYTTQKPEALLKRIIEASSDEGMTVADFFGGSGTTAAVCAKTGRHFITSDVGINSIQITRQRLMEIPGASFDIYEIRDGVSLYRNPRQTMEKLHEIIPNLCREGSLGKFWEGAFHDARVGMVPVYVPDLMDSSTKLLDEGLMLRILNEAMPDLPEDTRKVVIFYVDSIDLEQLRVFIDEHNDLPMEIELRDLKPLLAEAVCDDSFTFELSEDGESLLAPWRCAITSFTSDRLEGKIQQYNAKRVFASSKSKFIAVSESGLELIESVSLDCTAGEGPWHADAEVYIDKMGFVVRDGVASKEFWDGSVSSERCPLRIRVRNIAGDETIKGVS